MLVLLKKNVVFFNNGKEIIGMQTAEVSTLLWKKKLQLFQLTFLQFFYDTNEQKWISFWLLKMPHHGFLCINYTVFFCSVIFFYSFGSNKQTVSNLPLFHSNKNYYSYSKLTRGTTYVYELSDVSFKPIQKSGMS